MSSAVDPRRVDRIIPLSRFKTPQAPQASDDLMPDYMNILGRNDFNPLFSNDLPHKVFK